MTATATAPFSIEALNRADPAAAAEMMGRGVERSDWMARRAAEARPFDDLNALADWLEAELMGLSFAEGVTLLCAHPELAPPAPGTMTTASQTEQARLSLIDPTPDIAARLDVLNRLYRRKHGFPFVIALHAYGDLTEVLAQFESRFEAATPDELRTALREVVSVMKARLARLSGETALAGIATAAPGSPVPSSGKVQP